MQISVHLFNTMKLPKWSIDCQLGVSSAEIAFDIAPSKFRLHCFWAFWSMGYKLWPRIPTSSCLFSFTLPGQSGGNIRGKSKGKGVSNSKPRRVKVSHVALFGVAQSEQPWKFLRPFIEHFPAIIILWPQVGRRMHRAAEWTVVCSGTRKNIFRSTAINLQNNRGNMYFFIFS